MSLVIYLIVLLHLRKNNQVNKITPRSEWLSATVDLQKSYEYMMNEFRKYMTKIQFSYGVWGS